VGLRAVSCVSISGALVALGRDVGTRPVVCVACVLAADEVTAASVVGAAGACCARRVARGVCVSAAASSSSLRCVRVVFHRGLWWCVACHEGCHGACHGGCHERRAKLAIITPVILASSEAGEGSSSCCRCLACSCTQGVHLEVLWAPWRLCMGLHGRGVHGEWSAS
jgi:hypothetical protein